MTPIPAVATSVPECIDQVAVNRPAIVADVRAAFERYEAALVAGDVATLNELFWDSPSSLRFGVTDRQRGATEIHNWRRRHSGVPAGRRLRDTDVLTGGPPYSSRDYPLRLPAPAERGSSDTGLGSLPRRLADRLSTLIRGARLLVCSSHAPA